MDEVDHIMLDRGTQFIGAKKASYFIGLTATTGPELLLMEREYLTTVQGFTIYDTLIPPSVADTRKPESCNYRRFFSSEFDSMGRILYCELDEFDSLKLTARGQNPRITDIFEDCD